MHQYNILLLGSGGREHALAWKMKQSPRCGRLWIAPGNGGTRDVGENVVLNPLDFKAVGDFCKEQKPDYVVIGPEAPLVAGLVDFFSRDADLMDIRCVGPSTEGAMLEGSKAYAKEFMQRHGIPTAAYREFNRATADEGKEYISTHNLPVVLKADGLAAGKGVLICDTHDKALDEFEAMLDGKFGEAGAKVVVEEFLAGIEFSVFAITDGIDYALLPVAKDYKRIGENDTGLNTGGMGSVSPVPFVDSALMNKVIRNVVEPTINGLHTDGIDYKGFVFFGLIAVDGSPCVIEYNCRMGDPETQVVMPRLQSDLLEMFDAMFGGTLDDFDVQVHPDFAAATVCVSGGYPGTYEKGMAIDLHDAGKVCTLFHAGTTFTDGRLVTSGGRVIAATSVSHKLKEALEKSRLAAGQITFEGKYFRRDIGFDL